MQTKEKGKIMNYLEEIEKKHLEEIEKRLLGFTVVKVIRNNEGVLGIIFKKKNILRCAWVYSDDEGNDPGTLIF